eukprot:CAMPEP_0202911878 /NCGR_PEP_ID=MMETSP1392-20130828/56165_1 /ASSEMBLY_ACC=CAM_ASM_000868 /TAXON_ID=225041 /ORGANISM="Chlamydomonas chlamydogama, Strain SAG 11-48b" /LENGTH=601 /DNA_ID=CAMNT_0049602565 /DNA_START=261 /DNA_END=2067 /DNA_ORIENTATION=-
MALVVAIGAFFFSIGVGFFWPIGATICINSLDIKDCDKLFSEGVKDPINLSKEVARDAWKWHFKAYFVFLDDMRSPYYGEPMDISLGRMLLCVFIAAINSISSFVLMAVVGALKVVPIIFKIWSMWAKLLTEPPLMWICLWFPFWLLSFAVIPALVLGAWAVLLLGCFGFLGPASAVASYNYSSTNWSILGAIYVSFLFMYHHIYQADATIMQVLELESCCFTLPRPDVSSLQALSHRHSTYTTEDMFMHQDTGRHHRYGPSGPAGASSTGPVDARPDPVSKAWMSLQGLMHGVAERGLSWGWLERDDLASSEPFVFIGLPGMAVLQLLMDAAGLLLPEPQRQQLLSATLGEQVCRPSAPELAEQGRKGSLPSMADGGRKPFGAALTEQGRNLSAPLLEGGAVEWTAAAASSGPAAARGVAPASAAAVYNPLEAHEAQAQLAVLADMILASDIGYRGAANPAKLVQAIKSLKVTPHELQYMACHTLLMGDTRVKLLVPTREVEAGGAAAAAAATDIESGGVPCLVLQPLRLKELHALTSAVQSVSISLSKKEQCKSLMGKLLIKYATEAAAGPAAVEGHGTHSEVGMPQELTGPYTGGPEP